MKLQFGDLVLVKGIDWISHGIEAVEHSPYSHVAIAMGPDTVCEIDVFLKLQIRELKYDPSEYDVYRLNRPITLLEQQTMLDFLNAKIQTNEGYDWFKIGEMLIRYVFHKQTYFIMKNRYICSEIVDLAFQCIGVDLIPGRLAGDIAPADIPTSPVLFKVEENVEYAS